MIKSLHNYFNVNCSSPERCKLAKDMVLMFSVDSNVVIFLLEYRWHKFFFALFKRSSELSFIRFFEMAAMTFPCNGPLLCCVNIP